MARRGFAVIFTLLGAALFVSIVGFTLIYVLFGREPVGDHAWRARGFGAGSGVPPTGKFFGTP